MRKLLIIGDSIAAGFNAPEEHGWAQQLKKFIEERDPETTVANLSKRGATSNGLVGKIGEMLEAEKPDEVVIAIGLNDTAYSFYHHRSITLEDDFEANMRSIIGAAKEKAAMVHVFGITRVDERGSTFSDKQNTIFQIQNKRIEKYNEILRKVAEEQGASFADFFDVLGENDVDDGYHPHAEGHAKLFVRARSAMEGR